MTAFFDRREFVRSSSALAGGLAIGSSSAIAHPADDPAISIADLPKGSEPQPVAIPHFPSRMHAFVWRNWPLVPIERMAQVVGAKPADILRMGHAMGLAGPPVITRDQQSRSYITVIRRNWHLLPYEQLLKLLDWTPEHLAFILREDDVLYIKLGSHKPKCEALQYKSPHAKMQHREREIAQIVREEFPDQGNEIEPLFGFVAKLATMPKPTPVKHAASEQLRFCYSYSALYGDPLLDAETDPFPDGLLARLASVGVNGVWLQAVLHKLAPCPWEPQRSDKYEKRLENLRLLVARARKHGIQVFLYLNEPRAMPKAFFEKHPHLKGAVEGDYFTLCTSTREVQSFLVDSVARICRAVPELGGFFSITVSENLTNCWSHHRGDTCPRCAKRPPADVIAEVSGLYVQGIKQAGSKARYLAWDWAWKDEWSAEVIRQLPKEATLMSVSEWSLPIERGGVKSEVGEYSISAVGPGPRAIRHWQLARARGLKTFAKIQAGNTWELSTVPYIPALENVAQHSENLRGTDIDGLMLGWTLGGYPSPNLEIVAAALAGASTQEAMQQVAERRFGSQLGPAVVSAWRDFSAAFREYPYHIGLVYVGPQQWGPSNLLWAKPTGYAATMVGFPYDDLERWRAIYPPDVFVAQFEKVAAGFERALATLKQTKVESASPEHRIAFAEECGVAEAAGIHFRSCANQARFILARQAAANAKSETDLKAQQAEMQKVLQDEIALARRLHAIQSSDSRIGFEASNQYFFVPIDLMEKVINCRHLLAQQSTLPRQ